MPAVVLPGGLSWLWQKHNRPGTSVRLLAELRRNDGEVAQRLLNDGFTGNLAMEHIDTIEPWKLVNSPVRQNAELAARFKYMAEHELVKQ